MSVIKILCSTLLFGFLLGRVITMVENNETQQKGTGHHGKRRYVVRIGGDDEPFVFRVTQRMDRDLCGRVEVCVTDAIVIDDEFEDTVGIGNTELRLKLTSFVFQCRANEGIDADEFHLNIRAVEGHPFAVDEFIKLNAEHNIVLHGVESRRGFILFHVVVNVSCAENTTLLEQPIAQGNSQGLITRFGMFLARLGLNGVEEEFIAKEIQRTDEANTRVIASLKHRNQRCSFANSGRVLGECGLVRIGGVGRRRTREDIE